MTKNEYERLTGINYEQELEILAEVYRLALASHRKRKLKATESTQPDSCDDAKFKGEGRRERDLTDAATKDSSTRKAQ
jgi:hypothetical protein